MAVVTITVSPMLHENQERIRVDIPYDPMMIQKIRTVSGAAPLRYSVFGVRYSTLKFKKNVVLVFELSFFV
jgi:hypothetical protein